ncbi:precorrin-8X methylmutase [Synechococcus sp. PCC 7336]|uniref:precorrin-8X methylmutase n=1 Tax=Synechococcus sp. PCC 7336 TaxID=195250 RepID=UPI00034BF39C|nr:precorrin-8X methylmutase [Synechococcus sp. PCC 7336]
MEWHTSDAENLAEIDRQVGQHDLAPAEYEVVRRAIYATADFDYLHSIHFSDNALASGAAALAARTTLVVDCPMVQVGIIRTIQNTFANPVYCGTDAITRPQRSKSDTAWGLETLARRYPEAIYVIGQSASAQVGLVELIVEKEVDPALVVAAPPCFGDTNASRQTLAELGVPHICTTDGKGGSMVAAAILDGLLDLSWQAYARKGTPQQQRTVAASRS